MDQIGGRRVQGVPAFLADKKGKREAGK